jgi:hypothetical protein
MRNYFFILFVVLMSHSISAGTPNQQPPYITLVDTLGAFISDEKCVQDAKESIHKQFQKLLAEQEEKASKIQQLLNPYQSPIKNLFNDWRQLEAKKTQIVNDNLDTILNCSGLFRAGKRIAEVPGQIVRGAQEAAHITKEAAKTTAAIALGVPIATGKAVYETGKKAVDSGKATVAATVKAAEEARKAAQQKVNEAQAAVVARKDSYLQKLIKWMQGGLSNKSQPAIK